MPLGCEATANVVIVDDDPTVTAVVARWITSWGFTSDTFRSVEEFASAQGQMEFEVVLLDQNLPGKSGIEGFAEINRRYPSVPVIFMTAEDTTCSIVRAIKAGAYDYITKPIDRARLQLVLERAAQYFRSGSRMDELERKSIDREQQIIGDSNIMRSLYRQVEKIARRDITVLIHGPSGSGKELVARSLHEQSPRAGGAFVAINCAAIPESLQESELFGHERGAFTGATERRIGRFEQARGGTLFLDEVAELSSSLQAKLLRVLQEKELVRVGGSQVIECDFRLVSASHQDLRQLVEADVFRADLYYRLAVVELQVPALADRGEDIILLAEKFLRDYGESDMALSSEATQALVKYGWPGNVRELQNAIHRATVMATGDIVRIKDLPCDVADAATNDVMSDESLPMQHWLSGSAASPSSMEAIERRAIEDAMLRTGGNVSEVVRQLGIGRTTLYRKLKKYGLR